MYLLFKKKKKKHIVKMSQSKQSLPIATPSHTQRRLCLLIYYYVFVDRSNGIHSSVNRKRFVRVTVDLVVPRRHRQIISYLRCRSASCRFFLFRLGTGAFFMRYRVLVGTSNAYARDDSGTMSRRVAAYRDEQRTSRKYCEFVRWKSRTWP